MTPYGDLSYFVFLLYPLAVLVLLGLLGRLGAPAILAVSLGVIALQYADPLGSASKQAEGTRQLEILLAYGVTCVVVVTAFAAIRRRGRNRLAFYVAIALALMPLVAVKVLPLFASAHRLPLLAAASGGTAGALLPTLTPPSDPPGAAGVIGFLGISYVSFRVIDAIVALHDGLVTGIPSPITLLGYVLFVPTISSGPIDRFKRFTADLAAPRRNRAAYVADIEAGINRIAQGFLYKFILGYLVYQYALRPVSYTHTLAATVGYMYAYSFYLFFDFAGYSAFAIGIGRFFGIHVPENFNKPFISRSFREVWERWHISLSSFLRDHVYMRFMLTSGRRKWFRGDQVRASHVALLLTMLLMGIWHGLEPHYIVYGLYQGSMLVAYDVVGRWNAKRRLLRDGWLTRAGALVLTFNLFCFGLLIFSGRLFQ